MNRSASLFILALLFVGGSSIQYPAVRVIRNLTFATDADLPCWEVRDRSQLTVWITNHGEVLNDSLSKYEINEDASLTVKDVRKDDSGSYRCIGISSLAGGLSMITTELEVVDVSYIPELDDVEANIIRTVIVGASMAVFFLVSCGLFHFRWREKSFSRRSSVSSISSNRPQLPIDRQGKNKGSGNSSRRNTATLNGKIDGIDNPTLTVDDLVTNPTPKSGRSLGKVSVHSDGKANIAIPTTEVRDVNETSSVTNVEDHVDVSSRSTSSGRGSDSSHSDKTDNIESIKSEVVSDNKMERKNSLKVNEPTEPVLEKHTLDSAPNGQSLPSSEEIQLKESDSEALIKDEDENNTRK